MASPAGPDWAREQRAGARGFRAIAGLDEAGRGALAGPVVAAAVVLDPGRCPDGIRDSKLLTPRRREALYDAIVSSARAWGVGAAGAGEIDATNILVATRAAMLRALEALPLRPDFLIVDAVPLPETGLPFEAPFKADRDVVSVAAASILAKVTRDRILADLDATCPGYGFALHKGYGTRAHFEAIEARGPSPEHRKSFAGIGSGFPWSRGEWGGKPRPAGSGGPGYPNALPAHKFGSSGSGSDTR